MRISRTSWNFESGKLSNIKWGKNLARILVTLELLFGANDLCSEFSLKALTHHCARDLRFATTKSNSRVT